MRKFFAPIALYTHSGTELHHFLFTYGLQLAAIWLMEFKNY